VLPYSIIRTVKLSVKIVLPYTRLQQLARGINPYMYILLYLKYLIIRPNYRNPQHVSVFLATNTCMGLVVWLL